MRNLVSKVIPFFGVKLPTSARGHVFKLLIVFAAFVAVGAANVATAEPAKVIYKSGNEPSKVVAAPKQPATPKKKTVAKKSYTKTSSKKKTYAKKSTPKKTIIVAKGNAKKSVIKVAKKAPDTAPDGSRPVDFAGSSIEAEREAEERLLLTYLPNGFPRVEGISTFGKEESNYFYSTDQMGRKLRYTLDPTLQKKARDLLKKYSVPWGAIVAVDPNTGRILTLASHSSREPERTNVATTATFPAASLFKLITAAAAIERSGMSGTELISFRGGNYTLGRSNYLPDTRKDKRRMSFAEALAKSCNPVFARIALNNLSGPILERYATGFGFNSDIPFEVNLQPSTFGLDNDEYDLARTAAGFGEVRISPLHAALMTAAIANRGQMMRPYIVDAVYDPSGKIEYLAKTSSLRHPIMSSTAHELLEMMKLTVVKGTAQKHFKRVRGSMIKNIEIASKTGTLSGDNPKGVYHWFVATAPADNPKVAMATLVIDPGNARVKGTVLARMWLEQFFQSQPVQPLSEAVTGPALLPSQPIEVPLPGKVTPVSAEPVPIAVPLSLP